VSEGARLHRVFVYGTLKEGFANFHVNRGRRVPGEFVTVERWPLFVVDPGFIPWLVQRAGEGFHVHGQVYEVDDAGLRAMDALEQVDEEGWYTRQVIRVASRSGGEPVEVFVYFGAASVIDAGAAVAGPLELFTADQDRRYRSAAAA
jgi:gamma-glutamylaminecyclotransferase